MSRLHSYRAPNFITSIVQQGLLSLSEQEDTSERCRECPSPVTILQNLEHNFIGLEATIVIIVFGVSELAFSRSWNVL